MANKCAIDILPKVIDNSPSFFEAIYIVHVPNVKAMVHIDVWLEKNYPGIKNIIINIFDIVV